MKMIFVEDDPDGREILSSVLKIKFPDLEVNSAGNGREALEVIGEELPDLVLTDVNMPEMDGMELARKLRRLKPDVVIIFITADTGRALLEQAMGEGFKIDHCVYKPVNYRQLFSAIELSMQSLLERKKP
jgi:CheY-like chemotaxis protein